MTTNARRDGARHEDEEDEKWSAYHATILEFCGPPPVSVDLRDPVDDDVRARIRSLGIDAPFAVLTAENPNGENPEDAPSEGAARRREERNERRVSRLEQALAAAGVRFALVDGTAPDGSYRERCVAAMMPQADAVALAKRLDQLALFWFDGRDFWLLPAEADARPERLPRNASE